MDYPAILLSLDQVDSLVKASSVLDKVLSQQEQLLMRVDALHGLYSQLLSKVSDLEKAL